MAYFQRAWPLTALCGVLAACTTETVEQAVPITVDGKTYTMHITSTRSSTSNYETAFVYVDDYLVPCGPSSCAYAIRAYLDARKATAPQTAARPATATSPAAAAPAKPGIGGFEGAN